MLDTDSLPLAEPRYLSTAQAAQYLGISRRWLAKLRCLRGGPAVYRFGRLRRYRRDDLDSWAAGTRQAMPGHESRPQPTA